MILLYADDVVFAESESPEVLKSEIDILMLFKYCEQKKLRLKTQKSKIFVFRKWNRLSAEEWKLGEHLLQGSKYISYLGLPF